jgi:CRP/FNR family transcriptional regulator, cyclic AMP receptor protein
VQLRKDAKIEQMRRVPLFAGCSKRELAEIASIADELDLPEGRNLTREGELGHEFFVLLEGSADIRRKGRKVDSLKPGDFAGELSLILRRPRNATITTSSPVRLLVVTEQSFRRLLKRQPPIQLKVMEAALDRVAPDEL